MLSEYLASLDPNQLQAVTQTEGPVLILAGAGTGKTNTLTTRIIYILQNSLASPGEILAVTFTNKAAREMQQRVAAYDPHVNMWINTFHSVALKMLRKHAEEIGRDSNFSIIDSSEQEQLIKQIIKELNPTYLKNPPNAKINIKYIINRIRRWKDGGLTPDMAMKTLKNLQYKDIAEFYRAYSERTEIMNAMDFGDLMLYSLKLFNDCPHVLNEYAKRFKYIMVDEYQDTNQVQYEWLKLLASHHQNICCVGDDDQSIYSWRGADINNIMNFTDDFKGAAVITLQHNYRSSKQIVDTASYLIRHNDTRMNKSLKAFHDEIDGSIRVINFRNDLEEAKCITNEIAKLVNEENIEPKDTAILVRSGANTRLFEEYCVQSRIPYSVVGNLKFYNRAEVKDMIAYIKLIVNADDDISLRRIANTPKRGIGEKTIECISDVALTNKTSLFKALKLMPNDHIATRKMSPLITMIEKWTSLKSNTPPLKLAEIVFEESGYAEQLEKEDKESGTERVSNVNELISSLHNFRSPEEFVEHVSLISGNRGNDENAINIMTLHAAKGLEFDNVYLPCWEEGSFPNHLALTDKSGTGLEEERRLAYVGITRAKKNLTISYAEMRNFHGSYRTTDRSSFLNELPKQGIKYINHGYRNGSFIHQHTKKPNLKPGDKIKHNEYGSCVILSCRNTTYIEVLVLQNNTIQNIKAEDIVTTCQST